MRGAIVCLFMALATVSLAPPASATARSRSVDGLVRDLAVSPDGRWLAAAPQDSAPVLFYVAPPVRPAEGVETPPSPPARREFACPPAAIRSLAFTRDSKYIVVAPELADEEMRVLVFSTETAEQVLEIDCAGKQDRLGPRRSQVTDVCPGPTPSTFYIGRRYMVELWDVEKKERLWRVGRGETQALSLSSGGQALVVDALIHLVIVDPENGDVQRRINADVLAGQQPKPKKRKSFEVLGSPSMRLGGTSPDGAIVVVGASQMKILDTRNIASRDADKREKAAVLWYWVEALDTATGESLWKIPMKKALDRHGVSCAGERVAVAYNGKLRLFDIRTGKSKGKISATKEITAAASIDGKTWWYGDAKGTIRQK